MFDKIKNLFNFMYETPENGEEETGFLHQELLDDLIKVSRNKNLMRILNDDSAKTYLMPMYTSDINVLAFGNKGDVSVSKVAYTVENYFKEHKDRISSHLYAVINRLKTSEYEKYQLEDIEKIIAMFNFYLEEFDLN